MPGAAPARAERGGTRCGADAEGISGLSEALLVLSPPVGGPTAWLAWLVSQGAMKEAARRGRGPCSWVGPPPIEAAIESAVVGRRLLVP